MPAVAWKRAPRNPACPRSPRDAVPGGQLARLLLMPIPADAIRDDEEILSHCRDPQAPHVRGGWVVDLVPARG